ncbi:hypothetical protein FHG87_002158, partial [Trinorchestia longiramus]
MNVGQCVKTVFLLLLLNVVIIVIINMLVLMRSPAAVKEKYITLPVSHRNEIPMDVEADVQTEHEKENKINKNKFNSVIEMDVSIGYWDKSRVFKVHPFVVKADKWEELTNWNVCLSSQCSVNLLFWVAEQVKTWNGPMSIAVFVPDMDFIVAKLMIQYMRTCFPAVRDRVSFHFVYPGILPPISNTSKLLEYDCTRPEPVNDELVKIFRSKELLNILEKSRYPQNLLRNIARQSCPNPFCFTPDIDMLSIPRMSDQLNDFLSGRGIYTCNKCAYVIPTYEISVRATKNPENKQELLKLRKKNYAQEFHIKVFKNNQANSNLTYWEKIPSSPDALKVAYNITSWQRHWEPIYVTRATVPAFDERFIGYGFTRNSQVYEMRFAGYSWMMLDGAFLTHRGFQTKRSHSKIRRKQIAENSGRFNVFVRELQQRYHVELNNKESKDKKDKTAENRSKLKIIK